MNDRPTKRLIVSDSGFINSDQIAERVQLLNESGQKISTKTDTELNSIFSSGTIGQLINSGWYSSPPGGAANVAYSVGVMTYIPIIIPSKGATVDRIGVEVTTAGGAGAVVRLGIYEPNAGGLPATKLLDAGTIDSTSLGFKELVINQVLTSGLHWLAAVAQVAGCSMKGASSAQGGFGIGGLGVSGSQAVTSVACGFYSTGITSALTTSPTVNGMETQPVRVTCRFV